MKTKLLLCTLFILTALRIQAQDMVRIVRWISPVTGDFESMPEGRHTDAQLQSWGYKTKTYQYSAYKTRPSDPNAIAVYRWTMPNCAASIMFGEHEIPDAKLREWGYKDKEFQFYAYRNKPATGDFVAVNRWINVKPEGDKCRDFTLTVAETEHPDQRLIGYGYSNKMTQFWVPRPGLDMMNRDKPIKDLFVESQLLNPNFELGNLTGWTNTGNGFRVERGDLPMPVSAWGPRTMPLGGDYWQGLTPDFKWNNGRQGEFYASSAGAGTNRAELISSEFRPNKKYITFLMGVNWSGVNWRAADELPKLRVELLVADNGKAIERIVKSQESRGGLIDPKTGRPVTSSLLDRKPVPQTTVDGKSYSIVETVSFTTTNTPSPQQFSRQYLNKYEGICRIRVVDEAANGSILVDDVQVEDTPGAAVSTRSNMPLWGFVDLHTHPMSHLGFGKKLMHGAPDIGSLIPAGTRGCNGSDFRARTIQDALGNCNATHGGWGTDNGCGNYLRAVAISKALDGDFVYNTSHNPFEGGNLHGDHQHAGIEANLKYWPHQTSVSHQQMWWEWIKRAYDGGLRTMVALTVNNELLTEVIDGDVPKDDKTTSDLQIDEIISFVGRHSDFMAIARSSADLRRIVGANKLAVILGVEVDNLGNFHKPGVVCNEATVRAEIQRLYSKGVRYVFPIHLVDNKFGGTAVYEDLFNLANKYATGSLFTVASSTDPTITHRLGSGLDGAGNLSVKAAIDGASGIPFPPAFDAFKCPVPMLGCWDKFKLITGLLTPDAQYARYASTPGGHANSKGLTPIGAFAIAEMMKLGMLIDIDHMSQKSMEMTLDLVKNIPGGYPFNIGHNGLRGTSGNERAVNLATTQRVAALGGMFGVGTADTEAARFIDAAQKVSVAMANRGIAIGTDVNGMEPLPKTSPGLNSTSFYARFTKCKTVWNGGSREWDYTQEGVAHYGLMPDFLQDISLKPGGKPIITNLFSGAEYFARMWEKCEQQKSQVR
ncbi:membrane dipeptidase [Larkinella punicea]|nr:membrane dipeptidase [Larkinella punicea]